MLASALARGCRRCDKHFGVKTVNRFLISIRGLVPIVFARSSEGGPSPSAGIVYLHIVIALCTEVVCGVTLFSISGSSGPPALPHQVRPHQARTQQDHQGSPWVASASSGLFWHFSNLEISYLFFQFKLRGQPWYYNGTSQVHDVFRRGTLFLIWGTAGLSKFRSASIRYNSMGRGSTALVRVPPVFAWETIFGNIWRWPCSRHRRLRHHQ